MSPEKVGRFSRSIENGGLILGLSLMGLYGVAELVIYVVVSLGMRPYVNVPMPKVIVLLALMCVLPKYLGRSTAGQVWTILAQGFAKAVPGKAPEPPKST